jgi:hypothetical protein
MGLYFHLLGKFDSLNQTAIIRPMMNIIVGGTHGLCEEISLALQEQGQGRFYNS